MSQQEQQTKAEQAYINHAYDCLARARKRAREVTELYQGGRGGTNQARHERESVLQGALNRLSRLNVGDRSLIFGRIDPAATKDRYYIGRVGVWDEEQNSVVVDWRAPISEPFFRATGTEPMGLERRRNFITRGHTLLAIDDELFGNHTTGELRGVGALVAAMQEARTGHLGDIVATIQVEQDEIIRSRLSGLVVVQGGPGTGKTVVALHRVAYLLYSNRLSLESQGVLIVAPNRLFVAYTEQVLPALGEAGATIAVLADLVKPNVRVDVLDDEATARIKGDPRMVKVIAKAVANRERRLRTDQYFGFGLQRLRITVAESAHIVATARRRSRTHNAGRKVVEELFYETLAASSRDQVEPELVCDRLSENVAVRQSLDWMWPVLTPAHLLHDLYGSAALLRAVTRDVFTEAEAQRLHRPRSRHADEVVWSFQDVPLLDEARALLGHRPHKRDLDAVRKYGHICVDEAQDLSPMELRMVMRRSLNGSFTLVGDIAQATGAWANDDWTMVTDALSGKDKPRFYELTVGYRISAPTMKFASKVLPEMQHPKPIRFDGDEPTLLQVSGSLSDGVVAAVRGELAAVGAGNVAVIVAASLFETLTSAFETSELKVGGPNRQGLDQQVTLVPVRLVKGLEVDSAIVVEPARIIVEEIKGFRSLYVALTRATKRVTIVSKETLPEIFCEVATVAV